MSDVFKFKKFSVRNSASAQKVGTDGVLLGAWVSIPPQNGGEGLLRILDAGTGTGVIALALAQRCHDEGRRAQIAGIDIDAPSVEEASGNFASSPWAENLGAELCDLRNFNSAPFDLMVSNPPFFINSLKSPEARRSAARHSDTLGHKDLISGALRLLKPEGRLAVIYPTVEASAFALQAESAGLHLTRRCEVRTRSGRTPKRILMELSPKAGQCLFERLDILSGDSGEEYSEQYVSLLKEFYIKF